MTHPLDVTTDKVNPPPMAPDGALANLNRVNLLEKIPTLPGDLNPNSNFVKKGFLPETSIKGFTPGAPPAELADAACGQITGPKLPPPVEHITQDLQGWGSAVDDITNTPLFFESNGGQILASKSHDKTLVMYREQKVCGVSVYHVLEITPEPGPGHQLRLTLYGVDTSGTKPKAVPLYAEQFSVDDLDKFPNLREAVGPVVTTYQNWLKQQHKHS